MNKTQIQTMIAPLVAAASAWLAAQFPLLDPATWNALVSGVAMALAMGAIAFITKRTNLANTVAPPGGGTTIVTDKHTADALPANDRVVSNSDFAVVKK